MKKLAVILFLGAVAIVAGVMSCGGGDDTNTDAGGPTAEQTEAYLGFAPGVKKYILAGQSTADYSVEVAVDEQTFNRRTVLRLWRVNDVEMLREWFEAKADKLYFLRYLYTKDAKNVDVVFDTPVLYGKNPWTDSDVPLVTKEGADSYEYNAVATSIDVPAGTFDKALEIFTKEAGRNGAYYLVPDEGVVKFQLSEHPILGTIQIGLAK
jgi:hypothetical protein